jgi:hypothetical protein
MPISTNINNATALFALMTTSDPTDLAQTYTQTANIDMTGFTSESIAHTVGPTAYDFSGIYDGNGYTITIRNVVSTYTGLFDSLAKPSGVGGIVKNTNVIYANSISIPSLSSNAWGGLVGGMAVCSIQNCSVTINANLSILSNTINSDIGGICGFMGQNSSITNTEFIINSSIELQGVNGSSVGLLCGQSGNSNITNCSITTASTNFDIILKTGPSNGQVGLLCGDVASIFTALDIPVLENITITLNNNGQIIIDTIAGIDTSVLGVFCGSMDGNTSDAPIDISNCIVNVSNNQSLTNFFNISKQVIFFGQEIGVVNVEGCQFNYTTLTDNSQITINPVPSPAVQVVYIDSISGMYNLASGINYYIPTSSATIILGSESISVESQVSPAGIKVNGVLQPINTTFTSSVPNYTYSIVVKGVGSMYFGFNYTYNGNIIDTPIECICQVGVCSTNPQTGITSDSRITNIREDKIIKVNVDREFATKSVVYPKFKSYSEYIKYLQAGLKY